MKRKTRCGECPGCLTSDCGSCKFCLDMKKYGGQRKMKQACSKRICHVKNMMKAKKSLKSSDGIPANLSSIKRGRGRPPKNRETLYHKVRISQTKQSSTSTTKVSRKIQQKKRKTVNDDITCVTSEEMIQAPKKRGRPRKNKENNSPKVKTSQEKQSISSNKSSNENEDIGTLSDNGSDTFVQNLCTRMRSAGKSVKPFIPEQDMQAEEAQDVEEEESGNVQQNFLDSPATVNIKQEIPSDEDEEIKIEFEKLTTFSTKRENENPESQDMQVEEAQDVEEEESGKVQQNFINSPATVNIKQEIPSDENEEIKIEFEKLTQNVTTFSIKQENENAERQSLADPTKEISINGQTITVPNGVTITPIVSSSNSSSTGSSGSTPMGLSAGSSSSTGTSGEVEPPSPSGQPPNHQEAHPSRKSVIVQPPARQSSDKIELDFQFKIKMTTEQFASVGQIMPGFQAFAAMYSKNGNS